MGIFDIIPLTQNSQKRKRTFSDRKQINDYLNLGVRGRERGVSKGTGNFSG